MLNLRLKDWERFGCPGCGCADGYTDFNDELMPVVCPECNRRFLLATEKDHSITDAHPRSGMASHPFKR